jgi:hypothetical protein
MALIPLSFSGTNFFLSALTVRLSVRCMGDWVSKLLVANQIVGNALAVVGPLRVGRSALFPHPSMDVVLKLHALPNTGLGVLRPSLLGVAPALRPNKTGRQLLKIYARGILDQLDEGDYERWEQGLG